MNSFERIDKINGSIKLKVLHKEGTGGLVIHAFSRVW